MMESQENPKLDLSLNLNPQVQNGLGFTADQDRNRTNSPLLFGREMGATELLMQVMVSAESAKAKIIDVAVAAADELIHKACALQPLWIFDQDRETETLNVPEYRQRFENIGSTLDDIIKLIADAAEPSNGLETAANDKPPTISNSVGNGDSSNLETEASRATGVVLMRPLNIVDLLMNIEQWSLVFCDIVSKARVIGLISMGEEPGKLNGVVQVMKAELHVASPLVENREIYFARYCKEIDAVGAWLVVDVSLETIFPNLPNKCRRKPSGCLIQPLENGFSKVNWVEHNEVDYSRDHGIFKQLMASGFPFSAKRWISILERQCERLKVAVEETNCGRKSVLQLSQRICMSFNAAVKGVNQGKPLATSNADDIFVNTSFNVDDPGNPHGVIITLSSSTRLPVAANNIFELLNSGNHRNKWDILSQGCETRDLAHFPTGRNQSNRVSVVLVEPEQKLTKKKKKRVKFYVQESYTDATGYYIAYAPIDDAALKALLKGGNSERVVILGSGFIIFPETRVEQGQEIADSILTLVFQIADDHLSSPEYLPPQLVATLLSLMRGTISKILDSINSSCKVT